MTLNGYRATHRNKWLLIQNRILNIQELAFLEFCADIMVFDKNKPNFGLFWINFSETKKLFDCKSENTIRSWLNKLQKTGFIQKTGKRLLFRMNCYKRYIVPGFWGGESAKFAELERNQPIDVILQNFGINYQSIEKKMQPFAEKEQFLATNLIPRALSSSKDDSFVSFKKIVIKQETRTEEEYQVLYEEVMMRGGRLTINDMKGIDEDVTEEIEVEPDELEQSVVETFFDGDWGNYRQHLIVS